MANKNLSESQYEDLKLKEIDKLIIDRIRKKSEKLQLENKHAKAHPNEASRTGEFLGEDADDYINLRDCTSKKITFKDFNIVKLVGKGSFGKVFLVTSKENTGEFYAMKALKKDVVLQDDDVECTMLERDVCKLGNRNPYLTKLFCTFQNEVNPRKNSMIDLFYFLAQTHCLYIQIKGVFIFLNGIFEWWRFDVSHYRIEKILRRANAILHGRNFVRSSIFT
jgi:serine/threonine protein kinase